MLNSENSENHDFDNDPVHVETSLAKRITAWTSRGIFTAVVLLAGVTFGRQVLRWWAQDEVPSAAASLGSTTTDLLSLSAEPYVLRFGNQEASVAVRAVDGTQAEAAAALRRLGADLLPQIPPPTEPPRAEELRFLAKLAKESPVAEAPGQWRLYAVAENTPLVAGVRCAVGQPARADDGLPGDDRSGGEAGRGDRLVLWGIGMPSAPTGWTLYTFLFGTVDPVVAKAPRAKPSGESNGGLPPMALPPGAEPIVSLRTAGKGRLATFGGLVELDSWRVFFDRHFAGHGWTADSGWHRTTGGCHARFRAPGGAEETLGAGAVDVHLWRDRHGRAGGLVLSGVY